MDRALVEAADCEGKYGDGFMQGMTDELDAGHMRNCG